MYSFKYCAQASLHAAQRCLGSTAYAPPCRGTSSSRYQVYTYEGSDEPYTVDSGRCQDNKFHENIIQGGSETVKLQDSDGTEFVENEFADVSTIRLDYATYVLMTGNTGLEEGSYELKVENGGCFDPASDDGFEPTC